MGQIEDSGSPNVQIAALPKHSLMVLASARKCRHKNTMFNFEAVFTRYKQYMSSQ